MNILEARRRLLGADVYKKTAEGNPISVRSLARMYPRIEMEGWTEQQSTTGAQLINMDELVVGGISGGNGNDWNTNTGIRTGYIPVTIGKYAFSPGKISNINMKVNRVHLYSEDKQWIKQISTKFPVNIDANGYIRMVFANIDDASVDVANRLNDLKLSDCMLNSGSEALPWEPYTGGQPSPSPDYPQEIVNAGKYNEETQKWEYEIKLSGKNLFDFSKVISNGASMSVDYEKQTITIPARINNVGYMNTFRDVVPDAMVGMTCVINAKNSNPEAGRRIYLLNTKKTIYFGLSFEITDDLLSDYFAWYNNQSTNNENIISEIQIEYGDTPTAYEPYRLPQTVLLQSDRPLTKWDRLEKRDGQWGWVYKSAEIVLDGSEGDWKNYPAYKGYYCNVLPFSDNRREGYAENIIVDTNMSKTSTFSCWLGVRNHTLYIINAPTFNLELEDTGIVNWREWLSENPITIMTYADEETFVLLSEEEQAALNTLHTNYPTTVLVNDQGCEMKLTYKTKKSLEVTT